VQVVQSAFRLPRKKALAALRERRVRLCGGVCVDPDRRVKVGQHLQLSAPPTPNSAVEVDATGIVVRYVDDAIVVVEKPAGLTTVRHAAEAEGFGKRAKKFLPATLVDLLPGVLARMGERTKGRVRAVHRIDKETSGLVVLARTPEAESELGKQFRAHTIGRRYLALVRGQAKDARIESQFLADRGDGRRGSQLSSPRPGGEGSAGRGQHAVTHVRVIKALGAFTLVECELETGRTHQVRIHLGETGTPLCGERVYDRPLHGKPLPDTSGADRPLLHAAFLAFDHPVTGKHMEWHATMPKDMEDFLQH